MVLFADLCGQCLGVGQPVPHAPAVLGGAGPRVPGAPALPASTAFVSTPTAPLYSNDDEINRNLIIETYLCGRYNGVYS